MKMVLSAYWLPALADGLRDVQNCIVLLNPQFAAVGVLRAHRPPIIIEHLAVADDDNLSPASTHVLSKHHDPGRYRIDQSSGPKSPIFSEMPAVDLRTSRTSRSVDVDIIDETPARVLKCLKKWRVAIERMRPQYLSFGIGSENEAKPDRELGYQ